MSEPKTHKSGGGCFSKLLFLILLVATAGLGSAVFFAVQPQDLTDLGGYGTAAKKLPERDMKTVLKSAIDRGYAVTLSETELNQWLARTVGTKQGGLLGDQISLERVWVRLEEGRAEVILERKLLGRPFTVSMYLQVERMEGMKGTTTEVQLHGGPYHKDFPNPPRGGRFGKLVVPQGFLLLVMPAYQKLAALFPDEIRMGFSEMARIRIEKGNLVLDPREPLGSQGMPMTF
ncbi:MAG: hypothetical protein V4584_11275 [Verrucomicrobiota bacterium]